MPDHSMVVEVAVLHFFTMELPAMRWSGKIDRDKSARIYGVRASDLTVAIAD
jgi:hypothetical protein